MSGRHEVSTALFEEAGDWFLRIRSRQADSELHLAWLQWIEADPAHREAFEAVQEIWDTAGQVDPQPWPRPEELAELLPGTAPSPKRWRIVQPPVWALITGFAACAMALLVVGFDPAMAWLTGSEEQRIATARGEQQSAVLSDGSRIELGGLTGVDVQFSPQRRLVIADEGEVFYRVEHDPSRPFVVEAGPVSVKAIGTAFSVRREAGMVSVVVTEGVVEVNALAESGAADVEPRLRVKAGERIRFDQGHLQAVPQAVHTEQDVVWRRGRLRFEEEPLRVVVASLSRYTSKPIVLGHPSLQELRFTGTVFDDSVDDWLKGVQVVFKVSVDESHPDRIVLQPRP
ncbi:FecR family protein [Peristeroidobacter soli]|uniref:FecR family protein n=1 Tax=Peristeroidobacter soli TaxID=2497877 RepID=UPI00101C8358|nr:FecR domain-containing protein [Peristeroidobacter soli]